MNSKLIAATVIALSSLGATAAFADTFEVIKADTTSNTTRAAVMADAAKARADGSLQVSNETGEFKMAPKAEVSSVTRAQVRSEGIQSARAQQTDHDFAGYRTH